MRGVGEGKSKRTVLRGHTGMTNTSGRAQVGIGTLVIFVAMVLVASIAAGVLINTTGILQSESEQTGQESANQVSDRVLVVSETGTAIQNGRVGLVNLTVTAGPGSDAIDLRSTTVSWVGPGGSYNVVHDEATGTNSNAAFTVTALSDPNDSLPVLDSTDDQAVLTFDLGSTDDLPAVAEFGSRLEGGDQVNLLLTTESGASTEVRLAVPRSLTGEAAVVL